MSDVHGLEWNVPFVVDLDSCAVCGRKSRSFCESCGMTYCGKSCQEISWKRGFHRFSCAGAMDHGMITSRHCEESLDVGSYTFEEFRESVDYFAVDPEYLHLPKKITSLFRGVRFFLCPYQEMRTFIQVRRASDRVFVAPRAWGILVSSNEGDERRFDATHGA
jgi:hypothetical protein